MKPGSQPMSRWRLRAQLWLWRHGRIWLVLLALLLAALGLWTILLPHHAQRLVQAQADLHALQSGQALRPISPAESAAQQDQALVAALAAVALSEPQVNEVLRRLTRLAQSQGLTLTETDFQATGEGWGGLRRLQLTLPLRAAYPQVRRFVETVLLEFPGLSVDQLLFKRDSVEQSQSEIRLRVSLWINPANPARGRI